MTALKKAFCSEESARKIDNKYTVHRQGKDIVVDEWIKSNAEGTNIYQVIDKYGIGYVKENMGLSGLKGIQLELEGINNLQDIMMREKRAKESWEKMPIEIRDKFGNSRYEFAKNGEKWLKNEIKKIEEIEKAKWQSIDPKTTRINKNEGEK